MFRSYSFHNGSPSLQSSRRPLQGDNNPVFLWEAARAAMAAPYHFRHIDINGSRFLDGGLEYNNPSFRALVEAVQMNRHREQARRIEDPCGVGVFVSIGCGGEAPVALFNKSNILQQLRRLGKSPPKTLSDPQAVHDDMVHNCAHAEVPYFRFNVGRVLDEKKIDDCRPVSISEIEEATTLYLEREDTKKEIKRAAEMLVAYRRGRSPNESELRKRLPPPNGHTRVQNGWPSHPRQSVDEIQAAGLSASRGQTEYQRFAGNAFLPTDWWNQRAPYADLPGPALRGPNRSSTEPHPQQRPTFASELAGSQQDPQELGDTGIRTSNPPHHGSAASRPSGPVVRRSSG
jgi:hypothetical protein